MLKTALDSLTNAQKAELRDLGVSDQLRSNWRSGLSKPNQAQAAILEVMTGMPPHSLRDYLMIEKATPEQKAWLKRAVGKLKLGAGVTLAYGVGATALIAAVSERVATMYRGQKAQGATAHKTTFVNLKSPRPQAGGVSRAQQQRRTRRPSERAM